MILENLVGPLSFAAGLVVMIAVVPKKRIEEYFWVGVTFGIFLALVLVYLMQNIFGFWIFKQVDLFYLRRIPLFLSATWTPAIIIFSYLISRGHRLVSTALLVTVFPLGATLVHYFLILNNMLVYHQWSYLLTFTESLIIHITIAAYLYFTGKLKFFTSQ